MKQYCYSASLYVKRDTESLIKKMDMRAMIELGVWNRGRRKWFLNCKICMGYFVRGWSDY